MEVAVMIGLQASGKTTFCRRVLAADHIVVSKDAFPNARHKQRRQLRLINDALAEGHSVAVDNTNPSPQEWRPLIEAARAHGAAPVGYWFPPDLAATVESEVDPSPPAGRRRAEPVRCRRTRCGASEPGTPGGRRHQR